MSKSMIKAFALAQVASITEKTVKDRLKYTIAGCKDGVLYSHAGTNYGVYDLDAPDTEFITEEDLELSRITTSKVESIENKMKDFFNDVNKPIHTGNDDIDSDDVDDDSDSDDDDIEEIIEESGEINPQDEVVSEDDIKKAIKKGKFKKAQKMIDAIGGHKKLQKKLDKASA